MARGTHKKSSVLFRGRSLDEQHSFFHMCPCDVSATRSKCPLPCSTCMLSRSSLCRYWGNPYNTIEQRNFCFRAKGLIRNFNNRRAKEERIYFELFFPRRILVSGKCCQTRSHTEETSLSCILQPRYTASTAVYPLDEESPHHRRVILQVVNYTPLSFVAPIHVLGQRDPHAEKGIGNRLLAS